MELLSNPVGLTPDLGPDAARAVTGIRQALKPGSGETCSPLVSLVGLTGGSDVLPPRGFSGCGRRCHAASSPVLDFGREGRIMAVEQT
jgi:hypothetical protein